MREVTEEEAQSAQQTGKKVYVETACADPKCGKRSVDEAPQMWWWDDIDWGCECGAYAGVVRWLVDE